jgi:cubilin
MYLRLKADGTVSAKGFKANFTRGCGAQIVTEDGGVLTSPGYPNMWTERDNCSWVIRGARETDRVTLHVTYMDLDETFVGRASGNCSAMSAHLAVHDGTDEEAPLLGRYCGHQAPAAITSSGSALFVHLENQVGIPSSYSYAATQRFMATYTVEDTACGGELNSLAGRFASPGYPDNYPPGVECVWTITAAPGNLVSLAFSLFNLEQSESCNKDYLDLFINGPDGQHVGRFCGQDPPSPASLPSANKFWIKFSSDGTEPVGAGFVCEYHLLHGGNLEGTEGEIASPGYPRPLWSGELYTWTVTVAEGMAVDITFTDFDILTSSLQGCSHTLSIFDGQDTAGRAMFSGCGSTQPASMTSSGNVVHIQFDVSPFLGYAGSRFRLRWAAVPRNRRRLLPPQRANRTEGCGGVIQLDPAGNATLLTSPGYPTGYPDNLNCEWVVQTTPDTRVQLTILSLNLGK